MTLRTKNQPVVGSIDPTTQRDDKRKRCVCLSLGATPDHVLRLVLRRAATLIGAGTCLGLTGSVLLVRLMANLLFGTAPLDPLTFTAIPILVATVVLAASYIPAQRATRIDPIVALRDE